MKKGTRVWICDGCGKSETWRDGWMSFEDVESPANKRVDGTALPLAVCSEPCANVALATASDAGDAQP